MAVTVQPGLDRRMSDTVLLLIRSPAPAGQLAAALRAARPAIAAIGRAGGAGEPGPSYVSGPVPVPGGQLLVIDFAATPPQQSRDVPGILARYLTDGGLSDAEIGLAPRLSDRRFAVLGSFDPVARAWLRGPVPRYPPIGVAHPQVPPPLVAAAADWLQAAGPPGGELTALVAAASVPVSWETLRPVVDGILASGNYVTVLLSDFSIGAAAITLGSLYQTGVTLGLAEARPSAGQVADWMRGQRDAIRPLAAELGWAGVAVGPSVPFAVDLPPAGPGTPEDETLVPMWYQVLSAEQLDRLGGVPPGAVGLGPGRVELTIGEPGQWLPGAPGHDEVLAQAHALLRPAG